MIARTLCRLDIAGLLAVAEERLGIESSAVERARTAVERYDAESERLLAETDGRVKSLKARLKFAEEGLAASGPSDPETVVALRSELGQAEEDNNALLVHRLEGREGYTTQFSDAAQRYLAAGADILELAAQAEQFVTLAADLPTTTVEEQPAGSAS
jgi:hypothetical protein